MEYTAISINDGSNPNFLPITEPCGQEVELYFQGRQLKDLDTFSKSDPQVRVYIKEGSNSQAWKKVGETEVMENNLNPDWKTTIKIFYQFEVNQTIKVEVVDSDGGKSADLIGQVETSVGTMVGAKQQTYESDLFKPGEKAKRGHIIVKVVPLKSSDDEVILKLGGRELLMNTTCFCMSSINPYIVIDKSYEASGHLNYVSIQKTEVSTSQSPDPSFKPIKFKTQQLCNSNLDQIV